MKNIIIIVCLLVSTSTFAESIKRYQGKYLASYGWSKTSETSRPELGEAPKQQGKFKMIFIRENWSLLTKEQKKSIYKKVVVSGTITGILDMNTGLLKHTLVNKERDGIIYSENDYLTPTSGDYYCSTNEVLTGNEQINFTKGTGIYSNLVSGRIIVNGSVNTCIGHPEFLQNNFTLDQDQPNGYIDFGETISLTAPQ